MPSTKLNIRKDSDSSILESEIVFEKKSFKTEDVRTSIRLLSSKDYQIVLRSIGSLSRCVTKNEKLLDQYLTCGIYSKLVKLLEHEDIYVLKYTLKLLAMFSNKKFFNMIEFSNILKCSEMASRFYIETDDDFIMECSSLILLNFSTFSEIVINQIYSDQIIEKIFQIFAQTKDPDVLCNTLNLLHNLLDAGIAKENITYTHGFSAKILLCLLVCELDGVKQTVVDIIHKLTSWRSKDLIWKLVQEDLLKSMIQHAVKNQMTALDKVFDILEYCLSVEECAIHFSNSFIFCDFIKWLTTCPNRCLLRTLPILVTLTKLPRVRQKLHDICFDELVMSWLKYQHEDVIMYLCQIISNLSEHRSCCANLCKYAVIKVITNYLSNEILPAKPHKQLALKTLNDLLVRSKETIDFFVACDGVTVLKNLLKNMPKTFTEETYKLIIEMLKFIGTSKYSAEILTKDVFEELLNLYKDNSDFKVRVLNFINTLSKFEEFRIFMISSGWVDFLMDGLKGDKTSFGTQLHLQIISNLVKYPALAYKFMDLDLMPLLSSVKPKLKLTVVDDIIASMYDYCLTMKFYETNRLEAYNKIDDRFYLIQDDLPKSSVISLNFVSTNKPVYVVSVMLVKLTKKIEKFPFSLSSFYGTEIDSHSTSVKKRAVTATSSFTPSNVKLKAIFEHSEVPKNILLYRRTSCYNVKDDENFYHDYYLERYILILLKNLYFSDQAPVTLEGKVEYIAKFVHKQLSGLMVNITENEKRMVFELHLEILKNTIGVNVLPIGYLRMGYRCEKSLLFKVLCDNVCVPATLCKGRNESYWNEVCLNVKYENETYITCKDSVYVVDLMENVGELLPINSLEAQKYIHMT